jgi:hypothetical protein
MGKIISAIVLAFVLAVGANAQGKGKGKVGDDTVSMPEPNGVSEFVVAGTGVGLLAFLLRRKMISQSH